MSPSPLTLVLLLSLLPHQEPGRILLQTREGAGFAPVAALEAGPRHTLPLPMSTRSERAPRAVRGPRGIGLRLSTAGLEVAGGLARTAGSADAVQVRAFRHPVGWRVGLDGPRAVLIGPPELPRSACAAGGGPQLTPFLARLDAVGCAEDAGTVLELLAPRPRRAELRPVLTALEELPESPPPLTARLGGAPDGAELALALAPGPSRVHVLPAGADSLSLAGPAHLVDQLAWAEVRSLEGLESVALELRSASLVEVDAWEPWRRHGQGPAWLVPRARGRGQSWGGDERLREFDGEGLAWNAGSLMELWFSSPPEAGEGHTWTLMVTLAGAVGVPGADPEPVPAPARPAADPLFVDVAREAGIWTSHLEGPDEQLDIRPTMGPGAAWGDVDGDGWNDLYLVQGGGRAGSAPLANRLFRNRGDGRFEDVTGEAGCGDTGAGMGALFFDAGGDGDLDLYVANYGPDALYANDGAGRFADVRAAIPTGAGDAWSAGVCAGDADGDGDLDLYVTRYLVYDEEAMPPEDALGRYRREDPVPMLPFAFPGGRNAYLANESSADGLRFTDLTDELGLADEQGRGMQPVFWDFDRDGRADLYVANDVSYNVLWRNTGGRFEDVSFATGMDDPRGGMGVAVGDVEGDGAEDLLLTNWELEPNALYRSNLYSHSSQRHRVATFRDAVVAAGLGPHGVGVTSWGAELFDADRDGDLDLFVANGYTSPDYESTGICVGQPNHYFENAGEGRFEAAFAAAGPDLAVRLASRAAVACDYDQDGDLDLVVTANNGRVQLLQNRTEERGDDSSWLLVRLAGRGPNSRGVGAEVSLRAGELELRRSLLAGASYLGGNPPELFFGLGALEAAGEIVVRWPSGTESRHPVPGLDRPLLLEEPR